MDSSILFFIFHHQSITLSQDDFLRLKNKFIYIKLKKDFCKILTIFLIGLAQFSFLVVIVQLRPYFCISAKGLQFNLYLHLSCYSVTYLNFFCDFFYNSLLFFRVSTAFLFFQSISSSRFMSLSCNPQNLDFYCLFYCYIFLPLIYFCMNNSLISLCSLFY